MLFIIRDRLNITKNVYSRIFSENTEARVLWRRTSIFTPFFDHICIMYITVLTNQSLLEPIDTLSYLTSVFILCNCLVSLPPPDSTRIAPFIYRCFLNNFSRLKPATFKKIGHIPGSAPCHSPREQHWRVNGSTFRSWRAFFLHNDVLSTRRNNLRIFFAFVPSYTRNCVSWKILTFLSFLWDTSKWTVFKIESGANKNSFQKWKYSIVIGNPLMREKQNSYSVVRTKFMHIRPTSVVLKRK